MRAGGGLSPTRRSSAQSRRCANSPAAPSKHHNAPGPCSPRRSRDRNPRPRSSRGLQLRYRRAMRRRRDVPKMGQSSSSSEDSPSPRTDSRERRRASTSCRHPRAITAGVSTQDVLQSVPGVAEGYEKLRAQALDVELPDVGPVLFAGYADLVAMKRAAGRTQDDRDLEELRAIRGDAWATAAGRPRGGASRSRRGASPTSWRGSSGAPRSAPTTSTSQRS